MRFHGPAWVIGLVAAGAGWAATAGPPSEASGPQDALHLVAVLDAVLARYPTVAAATAARDAARAAVGEAAAARFPAVRLSGTATEYEEPMIVTPLHGFTPGQIPAFDRTVLQGTLGASWTLFDGGARGARIEAARRQADIADAARESSERDLAADAVGTYLQVLTARQVLAAADQRLEALDSEMARARKFFAAGRAAEIEVLRAEAARAGAQAERVRIATALDFSERDLARLLGTSVDSTRAERLVPVALADTTLPEREPTRAAAQSASPALRQAELQLAVATAAARLARSARWPEVKLAGNYVGWSDDEGHDALEWNAGAQLGYPVFTGGAVSRGVARADAARRETRQRLRLAALCLETEVDRALARVEAAHARVRSLTTAVERFVEVARIEKLALTAGSGTQTDYLRAEADLLETRAGLVEARHGEMAARVELARVGGTLDRAWVERTLENQP